MKITPNNITSIDDIEWDDISPFLQQGFQIWEIGEINRNKLVASLGEPHLESSYYLINEISWDSYAIIHDNKPEALKYLSDKKERTRILYSHEGIDLVWAGSKTVNVWIGDANVTSYSFGYEEGMVNREITVADFYKYATEFDFDQNSFIEFNR